MSGGGCMDPAFSCCCEKLNSDIHKFIALFPFGLQGSMRVVISPNKETIIAEQIFNLKASVHALTLAKNKNSNFLRFTILFLRQLKRDFKILLYLEYQLQLYLHKERQGVAMDAGYVANKSF